MSYRVQLNVQPFITLSSNLVVSLPHQTANRLAALEEQLDDYRLFLKDLEGGLDSSNPFFGLACYGTRARLFQYIMVGPEKNTSLQVIWRQHNQKGDQAGYKDPGKKSDVQHFHEFFRAVAASARLVPLTPSEHNTIFRNTVIKKHFVCIKLWHWAGLIFGGGWG